MIPAIALLVAVVAALVLAWFAGVNHGEDAAVDRMADLIGDARDDGYRKGLVAGAQAVALHADQRKREEQGW